MYSHPIPLHVLGHSWFSNGIFYFEEEKSVKVTEMLRQSDKASEVGSKQDCFSTHKGTFTY